MLKDSARNGWFDCILFLPGKSGFRQKDYR